MQTYKRRRLLQYGMAAAVFSAAGAGAFARGQGGRLSVGLSGAHASDSWDARTFSDSFMIACAQGAVFDCLTQVSADGSIIGELAQSWESSADGRIWTVDLRQGVTFHNGATFTAADVIASFDLHRRSQSGARPIVDEIQQITAVNDHCVQFTLTSGNADFPYLLSDYHLIIYPSSDMDAAIAKGIGTGLYRVEQFQPGVKFVGRRVERHYKDGDAGWFDRVEFIAMNDRAARMNALITGQVDAVDRVDPSYVSRLSTHPTMRILETAGNMHFGFAMRMDQAPFDDPHMRLAMKHGINRQGIVDNVLHGHGRVAADSPIGPANAYFADLAPTPFDPDRAQWHLRQAGVNSVDLALGYSADVMPRPMADGYRETLAAAGINVTLDALSADSQLSATYWSGRITEDWMLTTAYKAGSPWNETRWADGRFEQLLIAGRAEFDSDLRREIYADLQKMLRDDGGMVIPAFANWIGATSTRIATPHEIGNLWPLDNARFAERWWVA
ncbi:ABC transporter substrate-binding protein [Marivivens niveibacter]